MDLSNIANLHEHVNFMNGPNGRRLGQVVLSNAKPTIMALDLDLQYWTP